MGITNFCKLIGPPSSEPTYFDSLLIDCQSFLYIAIDHCLETDEDKLLVEICEWTWNHLRGLLKSFLSYKCVSEDLTVILSFDGEGPPMKWATQRDRRQKVTKVTKKSFYKYVLFGTNKLTLAVEDYLLTRLKEFNYTMKVVLCGCEVTGEGEHKIFHIAEYLPGCENPIIVSIDQDVFILAYLRLSRYKTIQIYRYKKFYHVNSLPMKKLFIASFLFGNDFIPTVVGISPTNDSKIHEALAFDQNEDPPVIIATFLNNFKKHLRFTQVEFVDRLLIVCFWMTYFWILDYYTLRQFPQLYLQNRLYDAFDRNQLLTGLMDKDYSKDVYQEAKQSYEDMITQPIPHSERHVFIDEPLLNQLKPYWIKPKTGLCTVLQLTRSD